MQGGLPINLLLYLGACLTFSVSISLSVWCFFFFYFRWLFIVTSCGMISFHLMQGDRTNQLNLTSFIATETINNWVCHSHFMWHDIFSSNATDMTNQPNLTSFIAAETINNWHCHSEASLLEEDFREKHGEHTNNSSSIFVFLSNIWW